jgi:hypothetical protein
VAQNTDIYQDVAGNMIFPMCQVKIIDTQSDDHAVEKTYEKSGYYVKGIDIEGYTMYLNRIQYNGTAYVDAQQDMIMNREGDGEKNVAVSTVETERKRLQIQLSMAQDTGKKSPKILTPKEIILDESTNVTLEREDTTEHYYVYVKGDILLSTTNVADAIVKANENMGMVLNESLEYIWKRSRQNVKSATKDIVVGTEDEGAGSIAQCINAMLELQDINVNVSALLDGGETPKEILKNTMKDVKVLDLTGCTVDEVLYYVSLDRPVFAMTGSDSAVLIVGYDTANIYIFDPSDGGIQKQEKEEADAVFFQAGDIFFSYLE